MAGVVRRGERSTPLEFHYRMTPCGFPRMRVSTSSERLETYFCISLPLSEHLVDEVGLKKAVGFIACICFFGDPFDSSRLMKNRSLD